MLIFRFFGLFFTTSPPPPPPLSSFSSLAFAAVGGCLLVARLLLLGFVLFLGAVSFISLPARSAFIFCLLGRCSTTWISSSSEVAFLLPFFREAAAAARTWSSDSSDSVAFALPFSFLSGLDISSISLSSSGVNDFLGGGGGFPPVDLRAVLLRG
jgi:hypothetical protein